jgi:D-3-phosphoglycerate dehydrogenase / 2-oxoglutarate reductase
VDIVDVDAATRRGIQVTNAPNEWCAEEVADHAVALWLAATRKICQYDRAVRRGEWRWQTGHPIWRIRGRIFGLVSFGSIARRIAERVRPFGVDIWAYDPFLDPTEIQRWDVRAVSFDKLVEAADYLVIQAPLTPETRHLFSRKTLRRMKSLLSSSIRRVARSLKTRQSTRRSPKDGLPAQRSTTLRKHRPSSETGVRPTRSFGLKT